MKTSYHVQVKNVMHASALYKYQNKIPKNSSMPSTVTKSDVTQITT